MSHLIDTMAYTGQTPWHQLGHALPKKQSIDVWAKAAGMQWKIQETPVRYMATGDANALYGEALEFPEQKVLYRSDTRFNTGSANHCREINQHPSCTAIGVHQEHAA